ncbi:hypothetical protein ACROYT_G026823 [Oculina patagonica]
MKNITFIGLFLHLCIFKFIFALYSSKELEIYSVFLKPYGISFKDDIILKVSPDFGKCADLNKTYQDCKSVAANLISSTSANEFAKLKLLSGSCPSGSYNCFYKTVKSDLILKGWFKKVQNTVRNLCKKQCWKTMQSVVDRCIHSGQSAVKESDRMYVHFVNEVLKSLCIEQDKSSCADKFVNGLLKNSNSSIQVCDVAKNIKDNMCSSNCHQDVWDFYNNLGCCIGSVANILDCYSFKPQNDSYGVFVYSRCKLKVPTACSTSPECPLTPTTQSSSTSPVSSSSKGKQIAGIVIAVLICLGMALIAGNYMYRRIKRKQAIRFEDYGYSRLKMLEDDFYYDVEDDDENTGLVQA